jgi:hypothetical protein
MACWQRAETALKTNRKENHGHLSFARAYFTDRQNLVFETSLTSRGKDFEPFFGTLKEAFPELNIANISGEARWSKFLLHGVPVDTPMTTLEESLRYHYPELRLAQIPRWLTTLEQRMRRVRELGEPKKTSTAVIALLGSHTLTSIGLTKLTVINSVCKLTDYFPSSPDTQCGRCYKLGHPTELCKNPKACGVCGKEHDTKTHPCSDPTCSGGGNCRHGPFWCANCETTLHKSIEGSCPMKWKVRAMMRNHKPEPRTLDAPMDTSG